MSKLVPVVNSNYPTALTKHWTPSAVACYERGCVCRGCPIYQIINEQCRMKQAVLGLGEQYGKPNRKLLDNDNK